ncbi:TetR/AcrR family transcriptional regulator [Allokutzneria albata]|uniref:DNA-binding transcriptional regulator, AcrR family n=1 Tax=Allokutzneria albata TaxID=211114 RepID=A0A1G9WXB6_ALLAB|nr:TetR family transcriptional regulator [Allokutzneria albata]SDM89130.1 DNA-binding transcriptional regulator, AcrR family [Allokutzneria albata]
MSTGTESTSPRRRGRRPAGEDTRRALLDAARRSFAEHGFAGATVRAIAAEAGVDAAMVNHWFGGKEGLFASAMELPLDPKRVGEILLTGPLEQMGERIVRTFLGVWDGAGGGAFVALMRSASSNETAARMLREFISTLVFGPIARRVGPDRPALRAALCGTQIAGLGMVRYVIKLEPLASADHDTLAAAVAPNLQRYLTGDIGPTSTPT